ncbi:MAG TPA: MFS transporter [Ktedonobacteraceae bacterium]|jgi:EmrB/QacA subfamily drug resistance transporter|nr:MFS transporter [Ktedonobacteraceae bacterium]
MRKREPSKWLIMFAACFGLLMLYIDLFIVNVALPAIGHDFHAPLSTVSWTISGYALMIGVLPMGVGRLGDLWGQRTVYLAGLALFCVGSLACGAAPNVTTLIIFRVIQGVGAAIMTPSTLALAIRAFPQHERGLAIGIYGGVSGLGLIAGPVLGGLLVQGESWRWIFLVNVPVGIVALAMTLLFVPKSHEEASSVPLDWVGLLLLSTGLLCLLFGVTRAGDAGWVDGVVIGSCLAGILLLALFVVAEKRVRWPLIDLSVFRNRPFVLGSLSYFFFSAAIFGSQPYWSLFMQNTWGFSPLQGGLAFLPATGLIALLTPVAGILAQKAGTRLYLLLILGLVAIGLSFLYATIVLNPQSTYSDGLLPSFLMRGLAIPIVTAGVMLAVINAVPTTQAGLASGTIGMVRNIGTAFGVAVLSQVYLSQVNFAIPDSLATVRAAADQFIIAGKGTIYPVIQNIIFQGFERTTLTCVILSAGAIVLLLFMRPRTQKEQENAAPELAREEQRLPVPLEG